jgi:acetyl-CoA synthetase
MSSISKEALVARGVDAALAEEAAKKAASLWKDIPKGTGAGPKRWQALKDKFLEPHHPVALHRALYDMAYEGWDETVQGPRPAWFPNPKALTNIARFLKTNDLKDYDALYRFSIEQGRSFWAQAVRHLGIRFSGYEISEAAVVDLSNPETPKWFPGARLNIAESCFMAKPGATAIIYQKEGGAIQTITFAQLDKASARVASALARHGYKAGDRFAIDMPMNVAAVEIFLGILKMGGTVVSLADSFKAPDIEIRVEVSKPVRAIFTQDVTGGARKFPLYPGVIEARNCPPAIVVSDEGAVRLLRKEDVSFADFVKGAAEDFKPVALPPEHFLNIIFSSSTSSPKEKAGEKPKPPKAIPWKANTAIKSAVDAHFHHDIQPGDVLCWPTNLGWMMGSFAIFGAFINKAGLALFDGNVVTPEFCAFVEKAGVTMLGLVPTIAEGWEKNDAARGADWSRIKCFSSTGSPSNPKNYFYLMGRAKGYRPVVEYMGGTEIGGGYLSGTLHHALAPSTFGGPTLGTDLYLPDKETADARKGEVFIVMRAGKKECPPMGLSTELLNFNHHDKYFERGMKSKEGYLLREHGDVIDTLPGGLYRSGGRSDDGININGIKTSSLDIENYIKDARIPGLREVAAVGVRPPDGGEDWLVIFAVKDESAALSAEALKSPVREAIKARNPQLARVHDVVLIEKLPLTASGKLRRRFLQDSYLEKKRAG